ncbi:MAG: TonB-dependent receptor [Elusimicrobia bacterium]|nr:TonB-dependent receptor [Elusimicrobiota bacterium]
MTSRWGGFHTKNVDLSQIPIDDIERIEVIRGGSSVLYGANAIGGLVNVITRRHRGKTPMTNIGVTWGSYNTQNYHGDIGASSKKWEGLLTVGRTLSDGFQQNSDLDGINVSGEGGVFLGDGSKVTLNLSRTDNEVGVPNGTPVPLGEWDGHREQEANDKTARTDTKSTRARLKGNTPLGAWVMEPSLYIGQLAYEYFGGSYVSNYQEKVKGADLRFQSQFGTVLGGSYERDERQSEGEADHHIVNGAGYVQQNIQMGATQVDLALRADQHSAYGNTYNPRFGLIVKAAERIKLSATAARSFRAPTFMDLYSKWGANPDLQPEIAWSYDAGVELTEFGAGAVRLTTFFTKLHDRIMWNGTMPVNQARAEMSGVEAEVFQNVSGLHSRTSYAFTRAIGTTGDNSHHRALSLTPKHTAAEEVVLDLPSRWSLRNALRYVHKQYQYDGEQGVKLPSFTLWDISMTKKILSFDFIVGIDNMTDKHYAESISSTGWPASNNPIPQTGRTYRLGVNMRFAD